MGILNGARNTFGQKRENSLVQQYANISEWMGKEIEALGGEIPTVNDKGGTKIELLEICSI